MDLYDTNEFRATSKWPYAVCSGCIVYRVTDKVAEVLLLKRDAQNNRTEENFLTYHLPKGHVAFNESLPQAAIRETLEEAGCTVESQTYLGALQKQYVYKDKNFSRTFHFFAALWKNDVSAIDQEHDSKIWIPIDEAETLLAAPNPKGEDEVVIRLKRYLELTNAS